VPDAVLLDALGTLVALEPPTPRLRAQLERRFGLSLGVEDAERAIAAEIAYYRAHLDEGRDQESVASLRRRCAGALGLDLPLDELTEALLASLEFTPFPDALEALPALRARGMRLVVASNWDWSLHEVLDRVGLAGFLDGIVTSAEVGSRKPAPSVFIRALAIAGVPAARAIHVGDSLVEDVEGARAAGIEPVLIRRGTGPVPSGVRTLSTLVELL
jgi:putative hydrolase of the HAD superfamily